MRPAPDAADTGGVTERDVAALIALGRDREAASLADARARRVSDDHAEHQGGQMDVLTQLQELDPVLAGVVRRIEPDDLDNQTPCAEFTVRGVLEHMVGGATMFTAAFRGTEPGTPDTGDVLGSFEPTLAELFDAMRQPGAFDRTIQAPFGEIPGETFARFVVLDGLVHGWDLATATGQPYEPSAELVSAAQSFATDALAPLRDGTTFAEAAEAPASATPIERLAAFTGRKV